MHDTPISTNIYTSVKKFGVSTILFTLTILKNTSQYPQKNDLPQLFSTLIILEHQIIILD